MSIVQFENFQCEFWENIPQSSPLHNKATTSENGGFNYLFIVEDHKKKKIGSDTSSCQN